MKFKHAKSLVLGLFFIVFLSAEIPQGYYENTANKNGLMLKKVLYEIIKGHNEYSYTSNNTDTWDILKESDRDTANPENVILFYTGISRYAGTEGNEYRDGTGWTREHIWPQSHGDFGTSRGAGTDVHNLRPCGSSVNTGRLDRDFANGGNYFALDTLTTECKYTSDTWEPRDAVKGDVARSLFYMATRYEGGTVGEPDLELVNIVPSSGATLGELSTLISWHQQDPVDSLERYRNDVIYSYQNNRNPFIDHPEYADSIWGNGQAPVILSVDQSPSEPMASDEVEVIVKLIDSDNIATVKLNWVYNGNFASGIKDMEYQGNNYYTAWIPSQAAGDTVYYHIKAEDIEGNSITSLEYKYAVKKAFVKTVVWEETFDSDLGQMTTYSISGDQKWEFSSQYGNDPGCAVMSGYDGDEYANHDWLITPALDLSQYDKALLNFDEAINYDDNFVGYSQDIRYSTDYDGSRDPTNRDFSWQLIEVEDRSSGNSWDFISVNEVELENIAGEDSVYIGFRYTSSNSSASTWELDNIKVTGLIDTACTGIAGSSEIPHKDFKLAPNYPNPFNATTTIEYIINNREKIDLRVYDLSGELIQTLDKGLKNQGLHRVKWNAGEQASGVYFIKLQINNRTQVQKCLLIK